jgi:hypothetical protein
MTTPSEINMTEIYGGASPALLYRLSLLTGMPESEAYKLGDPGMQNETNNLPCHFCHSAKHRFYDCPLAQDDSSDTVDWLDQQRASMQQRLSNASLALNDTDREELRERISECTLRIEGAKLYAHVAITRRNKTWHFNAPGVNWAEGECDLRSAIRALERLEPAPDGPEIRVPGHFDQLDDAVKQARGGQTIRVAAGEHAWAGEAYVPDGDGAPGGGLYALDVEWDGGADALPAGGAAHALASVADDGGGGEVWDNRTLRLQSPALLHGAWLLRPGSRGAFAGVSCYLRDGGLPGHHVVRRRFRHEEEAFEAGRRFRPRCLTTTLFTLLDARWRFRRCDAFCLDGTALRLAGEAHAALDACRVGAAGDAAPGPDGVWAAAGAEGLAYVGVEGEDAAAAELVGCTVQLTQVAGVRLGAMARAALADCRLVLNGGLGGAAVAVSGHARARLDGCAVACGESASPVWRGVAALEADESSGSAGAAEVRGRRGGWEGRSRRCCWDFSGTHTRTHAHAEESKILMRLMQISDYNTV